LRNYVQKVKVILWSKIS